MSSQELWDQITNAGPKISFRDLAVTLNIPETKMRRLCIRWCLDLREDFDILFEQEDPLFPNQIR